MEGGHGAESHRNSSFNPAEAGHGGKEKRAWFNKGKTSRSIRVPESKEDKKEIR
jgi:hypothetical protein